MTSTSTSSNGDGSNMPVWVDDSHMDTEWLLAKTKIHCRAPSQNLVAVAKDISTNQGRIGSVPREGGTVLLSLINKSDEDDDNDTDDRHEDATAVGELVLKQIVVGPTADLSLQLGLSREAFFYRDLAPRLDVRNGSNASLLTKIYYAHGDTTTGEKCIIMESLSHWIDSGVFFGPNEGTGFRSNPNNWSPRNLPALISEAYGSEDGTHRHIPTPRAVAQQTFRSVAQIHASFWQDESLLDDSKQWLRGHAWLRGSGKESWEASQSLIRTIWEQYNHLERNESDDSPKDIRWDPVVRMAVDKCIRGISWQAQLDRLHVDGRWTLVHGDFWPGNIMWDPTNDDGNFRILDWEMVGLGSGPQDLGQYVLSNMDPADRRTCERELVQAYYDELVLCGVPTSNQSENDTHSDLWEYCWKEYCVGGVERWLWFLTWFLGQPALREWTQFFHDQISAFMKDHNLTAADLTQPRP